jgi:predicted nucleic acid-binding Zn ribbon protein
MKKKKDKPDHIKNVLDSVLSKHGYISQYYASEIKMKWPDIVGEKIAKVAECTDVKEKVLYVRVDSSSWRQEISFLKEEIISKIRKEIHYNTIKDIIFY